MKSPTSMSHDASGKDRIGELIELAGVREPLDELMQRRVKQSVQVAFDTATAQRRRKRWQRSAVAASILVAGVVWFGLAQIAVVSQPQIADVARVARIDGTTTHNGAALTSSSVIVAGDIIAAGHAGRVSLMMGDGRSIRLDRDTQVQLNDATTLTLLAGQIYIDANGQAPPLLVTTRLGDVREVGTRFTVALSLSAIEVSVRDGRIALHYDNQVHQAAAGSRLTAGAGLSAVRRDDIGATDDHWRWAEEMAPAFRLDGSSLYDYLRWVARETGRELIVVDDSVRSALSRSVMHGDIQQMTPEQSIAAVIATSAMAGQIVVSDAKIVVRRP